ncbi:DUF2254 domain-containing protein [Echinicola vietnamensis]|uniref:Putative membrane protein n=1 Tax=Echinicola vietnamensis (strain DSM 17526 / LMG 23754 / KMM 6221) TaxID=926556 RepID=L0G454_ECHVK|nr:DUF2254 domain-containing protein [Echinicola vietnamensis]AGA80078.1 putative membrane protein [Echinicola vietnamensis DSM 17526]
MRAKLIYFWSNLQSSFWFVPLLLIVCALLAAFGLVFLDDAVDIKPTGVFGYFMIGSADSARSVLSTVAGAMIGVAGTVFSITLVALTLASSQFGPRLLQNFMHDKLNQVVLGSYIATFTYCLVVLSTVKSSDSVQFLPTISVGFAIILALVNIFLLVIFIHHISINIQADQVVSNVNSGLNRNFKRLFPKEEDKEEVHEITESEIEQLKEKALFKKVFKIDRSGYLQVVNRQRLIGLAQEIEGFIELQSHAGHFLVEGQEVFVVYGDKELEEGFEGRLLGAMLIGSKRNSTQDSEFAVRQMVEVASRALSPGVNDPYTAITCIDKLTDSICYLTSVNLPGPYRFDEEKKLRLILNTMSFDGVVSVAFNQIRQFGQSSPAVLIRLMDAMVTIYTLSQRPEHKKVILKHAKMIRQAGKEHFGERNDFQDLEERYQKLVKDAESVKSADKVS